MKEGKIPPGAPPHKCLRTGPVAGFTGGIADSHWHGHGGLALRMTRMQRMTRWLTATVTARGAG